MNTIVNITGTTLKHLGPNEESAIEKQKKKEYYLKNREKILDRQKKYYLKNKKQRKQYLINYRKKNVKRYKELAKRWYLNNKEHKKQYDIIYKNKYKERYRKQNKKYQKENRDKIRKHLNNRYKSDYKYKLKEIYRHRILKFIKGISKSKTTMELLGCTIDELWIHLEKSFKPGMTRENHGKWHVDHIRPCASFDLTKPEEQAKCFHYTNLQPLWAKENLEKSAKYNDI